MVFCLGCGAYLNLAQLITLPLIVSCSRISRFFWFYLSGTGSPRWSWTNSREPWNSCSSVVVIVVRFLFGTEWLVLFLKKTCWCTVFAWIMLKVIDAMNQDSGMTLTSLRVDGGMTSNNLLMQLQADLIGIDVGMCVHGVDWVISHCLCSSSIETEIV